MDLEKIWSRHRKRVEEAKKIHIQQLKAYELFFIELPERIEEERKKNGYRTSGIINFIKQK